MPYYRVYCLDPRGKVTSAAEVLSVRSDEAAIEAAKALKKRVKCEIWEGRRLVAEIDAYSGA